MSEETKSELESGVDDAMVVTPIGGCLGVLLGLGVGLLCLSTIAKAFGAAIVCGFVSALVTLLMMLRRAKRKASQ